MTHGSAAALESLPDNVWHLVLTALHDIKGARHSNSISQLAQSSKALALAVSRCRTHVNYTLVDGDSAKAAGSAFSRLNACSFLHLRFSCKPQTSCGRAAALFLQSSGQQRRQHVRELVVSGRDKLDGLTMMVISQMLCNVEAFAAIRVSFGEDSNDALESMQENWPRLRTLHCFVPSLGELHVSALAGLTSLTKLTLREGPRWTEYEEDLPTISPAACDALTTLTALESLELFFGNTTCAPTSWKFLTSMTRLERLLLFEDVQDREDEEAPFLDLDEQLGSALAAMPALQHLGLPVHSLPGGMREEPGPHASWSLPSLQTISLTDTQRFVLGCTAAATLAERCPNLRKVVLGDGLLSLGVSREDSPGQLQHALRALQVLDQRGWLAMDGVTLRIGSCLAVRVEDLEAARQAVAALLPSGAGARGACSSGIGSSLVLANPVNDLCVTSKLTPGHVKWMTALMPRIRALQCPYPVLGMLPDLSALPCLERLTPTRDPEEEDDDDDDDGAKSNAAEQVCGHLVALRVPMGRVLQIECRHVMSRPQVRMAAACLAPRDLRLCLCWKDSSDV